jgi:chorismate mutase/prephenate dehydratase
MIDKGGVEAFRPRDGVTPAAGRAGRARPVRPRGSGATMAGRPEPALEELRREVDRLDGAMVELLAERLRVVREIARIKSTRDPGPAIRPGREAMILRRLVARSRGRLPTGTLVRMWRELLAATTRAQAPLRLAAYVPPDRPVLWDLARDHFGSTAPIERAPSWQHALRLLSEQRVDLAILPLAGGEMAWWAGLADDADPQLRVVAGLPFASAGPDGACPHALVVGALPPEPSGDDLSLYVLETPDEQDWEHLLGRLRAAGLHARRLASLPRRDAVGALHLVEIEGFHAPHEDQLGATLARADSRVLRRAWLGGYARPLAVGVAADAVQHSEGSG